MYKTLSIVGFQLPTSTGEFTGVLNHQQYPLVQGPGSTSPVLPRPGQVVRLRAVALTTADLRPAQRNVTLEAVRTLAAAAE